MYTARVAEYLKDAGIEVEIDPGGRIGEFTVWVDGKLVAHKGLLKYPDKKKILAAVQQEI